MKWSHTLSHDRCATHHAKLFCKLCCLIVANNVHLSVRVEGQPTANSIALSNGGRAACRSRLWGCHKGNGRCRASSDVHTTH